MGGKLNDWAIGVEDELRQMATTETHADQMQPWEKQSIYKVPEYVRDLNQKAYKPQLVSFGPFHHMEPHLEPMEKHKRRALLHFLKRSQRSLESYLGSLAKVAQSLKDSYESLDCGWEADTDRFLMMMILDGCFMLEVLRTCTLQKLDYGPSDPIFSYHGKLHIMPSIRRDMIMLENQLPMLLLTTLLAVENEEDEEFVNKLILKFCYGNPWLEVDIGIGKCLHLLDVYRKSLLMVDFRKPKTCNGGTPPATREGYDDVVIRYVMDNEVIRPAMDLSDAGIRFKKSRSPSLKDISFAGGVLSLPPLLVTEGTESMFLNLIAFERFHVGVKNEVTSYIFFISKIIDSADDVTLLHTHGIIQNALGSDNDVARLFNSLAIIDVTTLDLDSGLDLLHRRVISYWKDRRARVYLMRSYFRNPWAILSFIAAVFLFVFTLMQTAYTIIQYYDPENPLSLPPSPPTTPS